jgi:hypothetical protein
MTKDKARSHAPHNRSFVAIDPRLRNKLNDVAAAATVLNRGHAVTQRQVHDALLAWALATLGDEGAALLAWETVPRVHRCQFTILEKSA